MLLEKIMWKVIRIRYIPINRDKLRGADGHRLIIEKNITLFNYLLTVE